MQPYLLLSGHLSGLVGLVPGYIAIAALLLLGITFPVIKVTEGSTHALARLICTLLALLDLLSGGWFILINISVIQELNRGTGPSFVGVMICSIGLSALLLLLSIRTFRKKWPGNMAKDMDDLN